MVPTLDQPFLGQSRAYWRLNWVNWVNCCDIRHREIACDLACAAVGYYQLVTKLGAGEVVFFLPQRKNSQRDRHVSLHNPGQRALLERKQVGDKLFGCYRSQLIFLLSWLPPQLQTRQFWWWSLMLTLVPVVMPLRLTAVISFDTAIAKAGDAVETGLGKARPPCFAGKAAT